MREIYEVIIALETASSELLAERPADERGPIADELDGVNARMESALAADDLVAWAKAVPLRLREGPAGGCGVQHGRQPPQAAGL